MAGAERRRRAPAWAVALAAAGVFMSGCSSTPSGGSGGSGGGGASDGTPSMTSRFTSLFRGPTERSSALASTAPMPSMDTDCPTVEIRTGASTLSATAGKTQQVTASDVRYQLSFSDTARQCTLVGTTIRMKVGVQGRVIVGPAGAPSQVEVPLRYAVVQEGVEPKTIMTKFRRIPVTMQPGATNVAFTDIEENISFPVPSYAELDAYVVYVGFDEIGDRNERRPAPKKSAPRAK